MLEEWTTLVMVSCSLIGVDQFVAANHLANLIEISYIKTFFVAFELRGTKVSIG